MRPPRVDKLDRDARPGRGPGQHAPVAQWIEQEPSNLLVGGSTPSWGTLKIPAIPGLTVRGGGDLVVSDGRSDGRSDGTSCCGVWRVLWRGEVDGLLDAAAPMDRVRVPAPARCHSLPGRSGGGVGCAVGTQISPSVCPRLARSYWTGRAIFRRWRSRQVLSGVPAGPRSRSSFPQRPGRPAPLRPSAGTARPSPSRAVLPVPLPELQPALDCLRSRKCGQAPPCEFAYVK